MAKWNYLVVGQQSDSVEPVRKHDTSSHPSKCLFVFLIMVVAVTAARAEIVAKHEGTNDPLKEGWTRLRSFVDVNTFPVRNDLGYGIDAWSLHDTKGIRGHDGIYGFWLSDAQLQLAEKAGWRCSIQMRIVQGGVESVNDSIIVLVGGGTGSGVLLFGLSKNGNPLVKLSVGDRAGKLVEVDSSNGYHLYEMSYDALRRSIRLAVDGAVRDEAKLAVQKRPAILRNRAGATDGDVYFGSTANALTSQANYAKILFEVAPFAARQRRPISSDKDRAGQRKKTGEGSLVGARIDKLPIPNPEASAVATKLVMDVYQEDFGKTRTLDQKRALASTLLKYGLDTTDDSNGRYVLFQLAQKFAVAGGDLDTALQAIDLSDEEYGVDALASKLESLKKFVDAPNQRQHSGLVVTTSDLMDEAISSDRFELAREFGKLALASARKSRAVGTVQQLASQLDEIEALEKEFSASQAAIPVLSSKPLDPDANLLLGKYYCFVKGDWESGITMLALGKDPLLKGLADRDIAEPSESGEQLKLGDDWWELALKETGRRKNNVINRARYWYQKALPELSGLTKARVEKRLNETP